MEKHNGTGAALSYKDEKDYSQINHPLGKICNGKERQGF